VTEPELEVLVRELAEDRSQWAHLVRHSREQREYVELRRDDDVAVWLICWMDEHDTGFHDHDLSGGAVAVAEGAVAEDRLALGGPPVTRVVEAGGSFHFTAADIHRVRHHGDQPAVTIHAYSPPLWRMGAYEVGPEGELKRHSLSYAEELRPLS
jgi:predicted metal-dependent enzyme (double-stranded beta helix superfamily)